MLRDDAPVVVRFAPSPTGALHAGGARTALFNYLFRLRKGGSLILRIEDTDRERNVAGSEEQLYHDLKWLGIDFDETDITGGPNAPYRQSSRVERHKAVAVKMLETGAAYRCWCSAEHLEEARKRAQAESRPPRYDRRCYNLPKGQQIHLVESGAPFVVRLLTDNDRKLEIMDMFRGVVHFEGKHLDDPILVRSDGSPTTLLAGVVDDFDMGMTHILRGEEWLASTPYQYLIFEALGTKLPHWGHLSLLLGEDGAKLSKRTPGLTIHEMRESGILPESINRYLAGLGRETIPEDQGWDLPSVANGFVASDYRAGGTVFSLASLKAESARLMRRLTPVELYHRLIAFVPSLNVPVEWDNEQVIKAVTLAAESSGTLLELQTEFRRLSHRPLPTELNWNETAQPIAALQSVKDSLYSLSEWDEPQIDTAVKSAGKNCGLKGKDLFMPIRLALTGVPHGPKLASMAALLGKHEVAARLEVAMEYLQTIV